MVLLAALFVAAALWGAGELHRRNCILEKRVSCSVLPWDNGEPGNPFDR